MKDIDDVSGACHGKRAQHYRNQLAGPEASMAEKVQIAASADRLATAEMLDEIHTMLCELLRRGHGWEPRDG